MNTNMPILILAAGAATRMRGTDKLMLEVSGAPLIRHQVDKAAQVFEDIIVTLPAAPHARYAALEGTRAQIVPVADATLGLSASLRAGINALPDRAQHVMVLLADLPDITAQDLATLSAAVRSSPDARIWRGTTAAGKPGHPIVFARALFSALASLTGDTGAQALIRAEGEAVMHVPLPGTHALADLDTPEAWAAWRAARPTP